MEDDLHEGKLAKIADLEEITKKGKTAISTTFKKLRIEYIPLEKLDPNDYNPNRQTDEDFELLLRSISEDGFTQPILVNADNVIVDGEHRWRVAQVLGIQEVPAIRVNLTPEQMKVATLRHNRARGSHDGDLETALLRDLVAMGDVDWVIDSLMMDESTLDDLIQGMDVDLGDIEIEIELEGGPLVPMDDDYAIEVSPYPLMASSHDALDIGEDAEPGELVPIETREQTVYTITLGYTHGDGYLVKAALGQAPTPRVAQLCRREL